MKCKLTGNEGKGVKAHIIPRSFYELDAEASLSSKLFSNKAGEHPKRIPIGIYDKKIVTEVGERVFSKWDDYGSELLLRRHSEFEPLMNGDEVTGFILENYDYELLKLFVLSVLWRASVSGHAMFAKVDLGAHEGVIKSALLRGDPGCPDFYSVFLTRWSERDTSTGLLDPRPTKIDGVNYYMIYLGLYVAYCKVDERCEEDSMAYVQFKPGHPLVVLGREFSSSKERRLMVNAVKMHSSN